MSVLMILQSDKNTIMYRYTAGMVRKASVKQKIESIKNFEWMRDISCSCPQGMSL